MAFEQLSQAYSNVFQDLMRQKSPAGQAGIIGQQLQNKVMEQQLQQLFPLQVQKLQKEIDFMISEPEKQRLEIEKTNAVNSFIDALDQAAKTTAFGRDMQKQGLLGQQELDQIDREWYYRLQEKKIPSTVNYLSGDKTLTPQELLDKAALSGKFQPDLVEQAKEQLRTTGDFDRSLLRTVAKSPEYEMLKPEQLGDLKNQIIKSKAFQDIKNSLKKSGSLGGRVLTTNDTKVFNDILSGSVNIDSYPELKQQIESYKYSSSGIPPGMGVTPQKIEIPADFQSPDEFNAFVQTNFNYLSDEQKQALINIKQQKGW